MSYPPLSPDNLGASRKSSGKAKSTPSPSKKKGSSRRLTPSAGKKITHSALRSAVRQGTAKRQSFDEGIPSPLEKSKGTARSVSVTDVTSILRRASKFLRDARECDHLLGKLPKVWEHRALGQMILSARAYCASNIIRSGRKVAVPITVLINNKNSLDKDKLMRMLEAVQNAVGQAQDTFVKECIDAKENPAQVYNKAFMEVCGDKVGIPTWSRNIYQQILTLRAQGPLLWKRIYDFNEQWLENKRLHPTLHSDIRKHKESAVKGSSEALAIIDTLVKQMRGELNNDRALRFFDVYMIDPIRISYYKSQIQSLMQHHQQRKDDLYAHQIEELHHKLNIVSERRKQFKRTYPMLFHSQGADGTHFLINIETLRKLADKGDEGSFKIILNVQQELNVMGDTDISSIFEEYITVPMFVGYYRSKLKENKVAQDTANYIDKLIAMLEKESKPM